MYKVRIKSYLYNFEINSPLAIDGFIIEPRKNIHIICKEIKNNLIPQVTCYIKCELNFNKNILVDEIIKTENYKRFVNKLDILSYLFSFSQKTHVPYSGILIYEKNKPVSKEYLATYFGTPYGRKFICDQGTLNHFYSYSLKSILELDDSERYILQTAFCFYILSFQYKSHIGDKLIQLWIVFEMLINYYSNKQGSNSILERNIFRQLRNNVNKTIDEYGTQHGLSQQKLNEIKIGLGNLNQQNIIKKADLVLASLNIEASECDIRNISKLRNLIFHGNILDENQLNETINYENQLDMLLERIILKILTYNNAYSNSNWKNLRNSMLIFDKLNI